jgi:hypothetical protein
MPDVGDKLTGQTAIVMGDKDVAPVAKILKAFAAEFKIAALKIGVIDKAVMSTSDVEALAELPSREVLLAQLLGLLQAPGTRLVRILNEPAAAFARLLKAKGDKGDTAPAPEVKKEDSSAEEPKAEAPAATAEAAPAAEVAPAAESTTGETPAGDKPA